MKKIGILTWYKAINHGAVLQTYASCMMIKNLNCIPIVLDYDWDLSEAYKKNWRSILGKFNIKKIVWKIRVKKFYSTKEKLFSDFRDKYLPLGRFYLKEENMTVVYIGSDMVFDLSEGYNPYMYGINVPAPYIFSYAASFGYTDLKKFIQHKHHNEIKNAISKMKSIGYRDDNTKEICTYCSKDVNLVENIDPVLAYGFEKEINQWDSEKWNNKKYLLIYAYESTMNDIYEVNKIKEIAYKEGLEVISCGYYHSWCDKCVNANPKEFIEMIKYAKYVVTDTFHGTVFSLIMHKQVCVIVRRNGFKIKHLLNSCGMSKLIASETNDIEKILHMNNNYEVFDTWRYEESRKSIEFIKYNINRAMENEQ